MKCVVTGAAGFMGSHLVDLLLKRGDQVVAIDNLSGGRWKNIGLRGVPTTGLLLSALPPDGQTVHVGLDVIELTLGDPDSWLSLVALMVGAEVAYHLAADATEGRSQFTPWRCTRDGLLASNQVFAAAAQAKVKRVVFTSSMAVYGDQTPPFREDMPLKPVDIYGTNKAAAEQCLRVLAQTHGFEYVILRPHSVYGPRQRLDDPYRNVVGIFINRALQGKPLYIYGDGDQRRAFSYIEGVTCCILRVGDDPVCANEVFNVGEDVDYSINHLADAVRKAVGGDIEVKYVPDRPREVRRAYCDNSRFRKVTGAEYFQTPLADGIAKTVKWAREGGPQEPRYMEMEIGGENVPETWRERLI